MNTLLKNAPVLLVFLTLAAFGWIWGGGGGHSDALMPTVAWLYLFLFEGLLFFPQRRPCEDALSARHRCWRALGRDPLLWATVLFLVLLLIPLVNRALCPVCDFAKIHELAASAHVDPEDVAKPPIPFFPYCVDLKEHFDVVVWFLPALTAMLAAKHALLRQGKRVLMEMLVWNAAAMAVFGFVEMATGAEFPYWTKAPAPVNFFSTFSYPNRAGSYFVMAFAFSVGLWQHRVSEAAAAPRDAQNKPVRQRILLRWLRAHYPLAAVTLNFFGALCTLSRAAMILLFVLAALAFVYYECALLFARHERTRCIRNAAFGVGGALLCLLMVSVVAPPGMSRELGTLSANGVADRVTGKTEYHVRVATDLFKDHPVFGVGGWGYRHLCRTKMTEKENANVWCTGGANVHNDYLQFLCEHGSVGCLLLLAIFLLLVAPLFMAWYGLYRTARFTKEDKAPPKPRAIYCLPAGAFWILLGDTALLIHAFGDCPMRAGSILGLFFVSLACAEGYLPREQGGGR